MIERDQSLILGSGRQPELLECQVDGAGLLSEAYEPAQLAGRFTGERIFLVTFVFTGQSFRSWPELCRTMRAQRYVV